MMLAHPATNMRDALAMFAPTSARTDTLPHASMTTAADALSGAPITRTQADAIMADILARLAQGADTTLTTVCAADGSMVGAILASDSLAYDASMPLVAAYAFPRA